MSSPTTIRGEATIGNNDSSSSEELRDLAQILRLMLIVENENTFRDVDVETLEQMIVMNEKDLRASFEMVSGVRPSSRVNIQQISEDYRKSKKKENILSISGISDDDSSNNKITSVPHHGANDDDEQIEIIVEDNLIVQNNDQTTTIPVASSSVPTPPVVTPIPIHVQLKLRVLKLKLKEEQKDALSDQELAQKLIQNNNEVQAAFDAIMEEYSRSDSDSSGGEIPNIVFAPPTPPRYPATDISTLRQMLKNGGFTEYAEADDETVCVLLDLGQGDVHLTMEHLKDSHGGGTHQNTTGFVPPPPPYSSRYISDPSLPWDKNPTKPITNEAREELQKEGRGVTTVNQLPYDTLEHMLEYLGRKDVLVASSVNQYFNKVASADYFWTTNQEKGKSGLIDNFEMDKYNTFTKNQTHYGNWKLWRLDNLFYTKIKHPPYVANEMKEVPIEDSPIIEIEDGRIPFKQKYAQYRKQKLIKERVDTIEKRIESDHANEYNNIGYEFKDHVYRSWIGFFVILALSALTGLVLIPLSMDEYIPNDIGTYYWLFSWLSLGIITIPYFYIMLFHHSHRFGFYPIWSSRQLSGQTRMDHGGEMFILFSSTMTWVPYIFLVAGLKYAVYPELPILSYIAIPGYVLAMVSFFCSAPTLGATLKSSDKERVAFFISSSFYGLMLLSMQVFLILLFAKMDGLEYALNIPFSIVFIPGYISLLCFPMGFFFTIFFAMIMGSDRFWSACGAATGFSFLVFLILCPLYLTAPFVAAVLDSFILQSIFPFVAVFSIIYGLGIIVLLVALSIACFIACVCRDYD